MTMNIESFFPKENATEEELQIDEYKKCLFKLVNRGYIDTQQYKYFMDFEKISGTLCNILQFLDIIDKINDSINNSTKDLITEFKMITSKAFKKFFKYKEDTKEFRVNKNVSYYLTRLDTIDLTSEQKIAMKKLYEFIINTNKYVFGLYGYAGTGKTTTIVEFVSYLLLNRYINSIAFTASTNKAVDVIKKKFKPHVKKIIEELFDRKLENTFNFDDELDFLEQNKMIIQFITIHKLLMYQTDYSISGEMIFVRDKKKIQKIF